jgi:hypothetical protein
MFGPLEVPIERTVRLVRRNDWSKKTKERFRGNGLTSVVFGLVPDGERRWEAR